MFDVLVALNQTGGELRMAVLLQVMTSTLVLDDKESGFFGYFILLIWKEEKESRTY